MNPPIMNDPPPLCERSTNSTTGCLLPLPRTLSEFCFGRPVKIRTGQKDNRTTNVHTQTKAVESLWQCTLPHSKRATQDTTDRVKRQREPKESGTEHVADHSLMNAIVGRPGRRGWKRTHLACRGRAWGRGMTVGGTAGGEGGGEGIECRRGGEERPSRRGHQHPGARREWPGGAFWPLRTQCAIGHGLCPAGGRAAATIRQAAQLQRVQWWRWVGCGGYNRQSVITSECVVQLEQAHSSYATWM